MAKSTVHAALASLQFKFQAKIREVGKLKKQLTEGNNANLEVQRLRLRNDNLSNDLLKTERQLKLAEFEVAQVQGAYSRLTSHIRDVDGVLADLRDSVGNWKSLSATLCVVGIAIGTLGTLAYIAQTAGQL